MIDSVKIGRKYFVKYILLFIFLPAPLILGFLSEGGVGVIIAPILFFVFIFPAYVRFRYPYFSIELGKLIYTTPWGGTKDIGDCDEVKVQVSSRLILITTSDGCTSTLEKSSFFLSDWNRLCEFFGAVGDG